jgi:4-hydroxy-3-methylbut-2-en-1-yl diphosphate reductase
MTIIRAKSAGFCWGVERAITIVRSFADGRRHVYSDGPLIHNSQMMTRLKSEGIREIGDLDEDSPINNGQIDPTDVVVVRAHGVSPKRREFLKHTGLEFHDATCPDVGVVAGKIRKHARMGFSTVIFGDANHPEVVGLMGYAEGRAFPVQSHEDIDALPPLGDKVCMLSQTTMFPEDFDELAAHLKKQYPNLVVIDTICGATKARQMDVSELVKAGANAIVVIGGHHSANTCKLADLARRTGLPAFHIETADDINADDLRGMDVIGVTAGASTPEFLIAQVCDKLSRM